MCSPFRLLRHLVWLLLPHRCRFRRAARDVVRWSACGEMFRVATERGWVCRKCGTAVWNDVAAR